MISLKKTFLYVCMVAMLGAFLAPTVSKSMQKGSGQVPLLIGLDGDVGQVLDFPSKLEGELQGINVIFYYKGKWFNSKAIYQMPPNTKPDVYLHLNGRSMCPLIDDFSVIGNMKELVKGSTTKSAIYIHLISKMGASNYACTFGKIRDQKSEKDKWGEKKFQSGIFLGGFIPSEQFDDVFLVIDNNTLVTDVSFQNWQMNQPTNIYRMQMDQLVNLLRQVNQEVKRRAGIQQGGFYPGPCPVPQKPAPKPQSQFAPKFEQKPVSQTGPTQVRSRFAPTGKLQLVSGGLTVPPLVIPSVIAPLPAPASPQFTPFRGSQPKLQPKLQPMQPQFASSGQKPLRIGLVGGVGSAKNFENLLGQALIRAKLNAVFVGSQDEADVYLYIAPQVLQYDDKAPMEKLVERSTTGSALYVILIATYDRGPRKMKEMFPKENFPSVICKDQWLCEEEYNNVFFVRSGDQIIKDKNYYQSQMDELIRLLRKVNRGKEYM